MWTRNITRVVQVRRSSKLASSPFFKKGEEHNYDRTTSAEKQFVLQVNIFFKIIISKNCSEIIFYLIQLEVNGGQINLTTDLKL